MVEGTLIRWKTKSEERAKDYAKLLDCSTTYFNKHINMWVVKGQIKDVLERVVTD